MSLIRKAEKIEIAKLRKNYLAKRRRLLKKGVGESQIPSFPLITPSMPRKEINRLKDEMKAFTRSPKYQYKQVSTNLYLTKAQIRQLENVQKQANRIAYKAYQRNLKKTFRPLSERNWATPGATRTVESEHMKTKPKGFNKPPSSFNNFAEYEAYLKFVGNYISKGIQFYDELYRDNTIKAIIEIYGKKNSQQLVDRIKNMDLELFIGLMETQDIEIEYMYLDDEGVSLQLEVLEQYFDDEAIKNYLS